MRQHHYCTPGAGDPLTILACLYELEETALKCGGNAALSNLKFFLVSVTVRHAFIEWGRLQCLLTAQVRLFKSHCGWCQLEYGRNWALGSRGSSYILYSSRSRDDEHGENRAPTAVTISREKDFVVERRRRATPLCGSYTEGADFKARFSTNFYATIGELA